MATNFSPCKGSYVLNQFPSNVMFGMNGFHASASGAIQGHHGPLVSYCVILVISIVLRETTLTISVSMGEVVSLESKTVRVVSLSKTDISKIT